MEIYDLQVNHLVNPLGFRMERTSFSWKVRKASGNKQAAARVVVSANAAMQEVLVDTGWRADADSLAYPVELDLAPRTRYFYQVFVRSDADEEAVSAVNWFETAKMDEPWEAQWISCDSSERRHPVFEREVAPRGSVVSARLYICGLGLYEASFNGRKIGEEFLTPYSNDYDRWVQYQTFDVTELLGEPGTLAVTLGNGWYKSRFGFSAYEDVGYYGDDWKLIAELRIAYADGSEEVVGTDGGWAVRRSNITFSNLYDGEHVDMTLPELPVEPAAVCDAPKGALTARMSLPVVSHEVFHPAELIHTPAGELVFDMGQEFTGIFRLHVDVPRGTEVHIQTGEILQNGNFYNANLRTAKSEYRYVSAGGPAIIEPRFTFFGYRYVKVEGVPELSVDDFEGVALYSAIEERGRIHTGHDLVNRLISNIRWGLKCNFVDVPTDCPQRDERMGWTGDAQVFSPAATYLEDTYAFYAKYLFDMYQEQLDLDGMVPDVVPSAGVHSCATVWGDAACIIPWNVYRFYGDKSILEDQFASMKAWVDYVRRIDGDDHAWRRHFHYGDWLALDNMNGDAEQSFGATDEGYIASVYYAASAGIVSRAAAVLGFAEEEREYAELSERLFDEVRREYFSETGRCCEKTQTGLLLALHFNLTDNRELAIDQLKKLFERTGDKLNTGFVGTPLLCLTLSDNGMDDLAWKLLLNEEYPGWLREVKLGATTVWERWNSLDDDGVITGIGMNSMNHYAYGSIAEWLFRRAAGLEFDAGEPGCRHASLRPSLNEELCELEASYDSPAGEYALSWKIADDGRVDLVAMVPFGCTATITLPRYGEQGEAVRELGPGEYRFAYKASAVLGER